MLTSASNSSKFNFCLCIARKFSLWDLKSQLSPLPWFDFILLGWLLSRYEASFLLVGIFLWVCVVSRLLQDFSSLFWKRKALSLYLKNGTCCTSAFPRGIECHLVAVHEYIPTWGASRGWSLPTPWYPCSILQAVNSPETVPGQWAVISWMGINGCFY